MNFFNGNLFQYIGEALHVETNELFALTRNSNKELIAVPKEQFNQYAIKDHSVLHETQKELFNLKDSLEVTEINGQSCYTIGQGTHAVTRETLTFYLTTTRKIYAS